MARTDTVIRLRKNQTLRMKPFNGLYQTGKAIVSKSIVIILFLALWEVIPRLGLVEVAFFPPISVVLSGLWELIATGQLTTHLVASLTRSVVGFTLALIIAIPIGLLIGWFKPISDLFNPILEAFRNTAALAILPVFILLLGIGEASKVAVVLYACFFPILLSTISSVRNVDPLFIKSARSMALSPFRLFIKVILPAAIPTIFVGIRLAAAGSILVLMAAEMIGAKAGLGYLIINSQHSFQIPYMYAGIITISVIGMLVNYSLLRLEKRLTPWKID
ncbi:ABC transporter permease [Alkalihalobacillus alcalophilus ATCC 27647 = CGMCC 1.3604]|uniref:ABC transporter permease n=1 Tax=Alkalihalobacillus alcalophilus ATCC 27647 = CGMCC 1.3604 TaxID=1218173 RepID=A0A094WPF1_ALKAL|nr:ABC transporter permease [Alkalihalobacillus alcalophilus ATCC 27647 = CGMCC 1.3604]THG89762.1 ABC transporter permease [Alkalihalobacillus alcalophilus ATCC 27647 = CGMCC 1.3604]